MSKKPLISVIVPVYNIEDLISKCLWSIILSKYENIEIIVVDDGSTDNSLSICKELAKKDTRIKVFHQKNCGLSAARNFGIKKASGEFVAFVDGDDFIDPDFISELYKSLKKNEADISVCGFTEIRNDKMKFFTPKEEVLSGLMGTIRILTKQNNLDIITWNKLYRKALFKNVSFPKGRVHEDNLTTYKLFVAASKISYIDKALYNYVRRDNSITGMSKQFDQLMAKNDAVVDSKKLFKSNKELFQAALYSEVFIYFQFLDNAILGNIPKKYYKKYRKKILKGLDDMSKNPYFDRKRKIYCVLLKPFDGFFYKIYRKIKR